MTVLLQTVGITQTNVAQVSVRFVVDTKVGVSNVHKQQSAVSVLEVAAVGVARVVE